MNTILLAFASILLVLMVFSYIVRRTYRAPIVIEQGDPEDFGLAFRTVSILTTKGKHLFAWYIRAPNTTKPVPAVAILHGWGGNAETMLPFARLLHVVGFAVLLLDARNHGRSDRDSFSSLPRFAEDLESALEWLTGQPEVNPRQLAALGHSVGAGAALLAASRRDDLAAVVSIAAFAHPGDLIRRQLQAHSVPYWPVGWFVARYIEWTIGARFDQIAPCNTIRRIDCPVLLVHGERDSRIPPTDARRIYAQRRDNRVRLAILPMVDHDSLEAIQVHGSTLVSFLDGALYPRQR